MDKKEYIKNLLERYNDGSLTPGESQELSSIMGSGDEDKDLVELFSENWHEALNTDPNVQTYKILGKLEQQIKNTTKTGNKPENIVIRRLRPFLKYAAIIVVSLGIGWLIRGTNHNKRALTGTYTGLANNEITVSYGSKTKVKLPDGSVVNLNSGSLLRYPARFDSNFRRVYVEGEAYFDVEKDTALPFLVETKDITIRVLGTEFNVKAYNDEKTVETVLVTGAIEIYSNNKEIADKNRLLVLKPNQQATFQREGRSIAVSEVRSKADTRNSGAKLAMSVDKKVDISNFIAWKENKLVFRDETFDDLAKKMERWYDVEINITDKSLLNVQFTGTFEKQTVEQALNALRITTPFQYQMEKNLIVISKLNY